MQRDDAIRLLRGRSEQFHDLGVGRLFLYGSVARDEAREDRRWSKKIYNNAISVPNREMQQYRTAGRTGHRPRSWRSAADR
jgi:hypothetical protein